jgi:hypothetical protein
VNSEPEYIPLQGTYKHISSKAAILYLKGSKLVLPGAMFPTYGLDQYSCLTYFPMEQAIAILESFEIKGIFSLGRYLTYAN